MGFGNDLNFLDELNNPDFSEPPFHSARDGKVIPEEQQLEHIKNLEWRNKDSGG
ncbi:MAG: hypothetical protein IPG76_13945 [Acidobacteria bacterium]|nr:hypothetical protein [Acidobacteriota bacterium]